MSLNSQIADLILEKGRAQAQGAIGSGQAWGSALQNIGQTIGVIPQQIAQQKAEAQTSALRAAQLAAAQSPLDDKAALDAATVTPSGPTQSGVPMQAPTRQQVLDSLPGHLKPIVQEQYDKADEAAARVQEAHSKARAANLSAEKETTDYVNGIADNVAAHNFDPAAAFIAIGHAKETFKDNPSLLNQVSQMEQSIQANPTPEAVKSIIAPIIAARDAQAGTETINGQLVNKRTGAPVGAPVPKQVTPLAPEEIALKNKEIQEIDAKLKGTVPMSDKDKQELAIQRARLAEDIRNHNAVNNPLGAGPVPAGGGSAAAPAVSGADFLASLPPGAQTTVKALAEGRMAFPGGAAMRSPYWQSMVQAVGQYDPSFDTTNFNARNKTRSDLESPSGKGGQSIGAINTALQHAGKLSDLIEQLDNTNIPLANAVVNPLKSAMGNTAVTNFNAVAPQLMKEIEKAWRGTGGSAGEIQDLVKSIGQNHGKQQQREALGEFVDLLKGKLDSLQQQRDNALGPIASKQIPILFDQNTPIIQKIADRSEGAASASMTRTIKNSKTGETKTQTSTDGGLTWK